MAITQPTNPGFEDAGASAGLADAWTTTATADGTGGYTASLYADFSGGGDPARSAESFAVGWDVDPYVREVEGGTGAFFNGTTAIELYTYEGFSLWLGSAPYQREVTAGTAATFGASLATAETFTDDGWGTGASYVTEVDTGGTGGPVDGFETGWGNDAYVTVVSGGDAAEFHKPTVGTDIFESFEHVSPDLVFTVPNPSNDTCVTAAVHGKSNGFRVTVTSTVRPPAPLADNVPYYFVNASGAGFQVALSQGGSAIDLTDAGLGTHTLHADETAYWTSPVGEAF